MIIPSLLHGTGAGCQIQFDGLSTGRKLIQLFGQPTKRKFEGPQQKYAITKWTQMKISNMFYKCIPINIIILYIYYKQHAKIIFEGPQQKYVITKDPIENRQYIF